MSDRVGYNIGPSLPDPFTNHSEGSGGGDGGGGGGGGGYYENTVTQLTGSPGIAYHLKMDDGSANAGDPIADATGTFSPYVVGDNLTAGGPSLVASGAGSSIQNIESASSYVFLNGTSQMSSPDRALAFGFQKSSLVTNDQFIRYQDTATGTDLTIHLGDSYIGIPFDVDGQSLFPFTNYTWVVDTPYWIVLNCNATETQIWINGVKEATDDPVSSTITMSEDMQIGTDIDGYFDEVTEFTTALTPTQIQELYDGATI